MRLRPALAVVVIACTVEAVSCGRVENVGKFWVIRYQADIGELRDVNPTLFVKTASGEVEVMGRIESYRQVAADCIVFSSFVDGEYYFACSGRRPLVIRGDGLRGRATIAFDGRSVRLIDNAPGPPRQLLFSVAEARRVASSQPPIDASWRTGPRLTEITPLTVR